MKASFPEVLALILIASAMAIAAQNWLVYIAFIWGYGSVRIFMYRILSRRLRIRRGFFRSLS